MGQAPKARPTRRPGLVALGVALMAVCGLGGAAALNASGESTPVVVATATQQAGHVLTAADVRVVQLEGHPEIVSVSSPDQVIGKVLAAPVSAGAALTPEVVAAEPYNGGARVGISVKASGMPVVGLQRSDRVLISRGGGAAAAPAAAPSAGGKAAAVGGPWVGTVLAVGPMREDGTLSVDVQVNEADVASVASVAGDGNAVLVLTQRGVDAAAAPGAKQGG